MSLLGDPPPELAPLPRELFAGLSALLAILAPPLIDPSITKATARDDGVEIVLAHAREIAFAIWVQAATTEITVGCAALHEEHRDAAAALASIGQLLCGEREVRGYDGAPLRPDFGARTSR
jgi:hypothetical protein